MDHQKRFLFHDDGCYSAGGA